MRSFVTREGRTMALVEAGDIHNKELNECPSCYYELLFGEFGPCGHPLLVLFFRLKKKDCLWCKTDCRTFRRYLPISLLDIE